MNQITQISVQSVFVFRAHPVFVIVPRGVDAALPVGFVQIGQISPVLLRVRQTERIGSRGERTVHSSKQMKGNGPVHVPGGTGRVVYLVRLYDNFTCRRVFAAVQWYGLLNFQLLKGQRTTSIFTSACT